ncbi:hypothetical protein [Lachnoclostridium sp.]|uniref:hypothetical protein n=1 Tax=Lachnoclostridium sp. TaxID=2028282 RepID=UPI00289F8824|nr:hypothetical protein [Lachnoclostridium sp.]
MNKKKYIYGFILGFTLTTITACFPKKDEINVTLPHDQESNIDENQTSDFVEKQVDTLSIIDEFHNLISDESSIKEITAFMNKKIADATGEEVSEMILKLEEYHINRREQEEEKYLTEALQKGLNAIQTSNSDINQVDSIKDETIKELVIELKENGYKMETVEGYYFPVIDYSFYKQFSSHASPEMKDYINIMTVESDCVFSKAEILMIGWDEVVNRIISMEKFLNQYPESKKADYIKLLYDNYVFITLYGLNNPPLFDYESKKMDEDAKQAYATALTQSVDSEFLKLLGEFMALVEKNDYTLTDDVESFRKANTSSNLNENNEISKDPNRYQVAGIDDADEFDETYELLRIALRDNDRDTFADYIAYPIKVRINDKKTEIKNKDEFIKNFDDIMNEDVKNTFLNQKLDEFFVNYQGIMVGNGQFWLNQIEGTKHKFSIYAINN